MQSGASQFCQTQTVHRSVLLFFLVGLLDMFSEMNDVCFEVVVYFGVCLRCLAKGGWPSEVAVGVFMFWGKRLGGSMIF